jgi:DNA-binding XRE family transcriptional regulator
MESYAHEIRQWRESLGWSRRKLASKFGTSTRRITACETDSQPVPRKEKRTYPMVFIQFLGYKVRCRRDWPVEDKKFNLVDMQEQILGSFNSSRLK